MKKNKISMLIAAVILTLSVAGCSAAAETEGTGAQTSAQETLAVKAPAEETTAAESTAVSETAAAEQTVIRVGGLKGPTTMGLVKLMEDAQNGNSQNQYEFTMVTAADELTALVAGGKVDIALMPANLSAVLYQKTEQNISVIDINTLGVLYLVSADPSLEENSIESLKGKTVYLPGKGTTPEYALRYLIARSGLSEEDVTLEFKSEATEVASILAADSSAIGLLPQPFVTVALSQNEALNVVGDLSAIWDDMNSDSRLVTGVTVVTNDFLNAHQDLVDIFLEEHEASIQFTKEDPETAAALIAEAGIVAKAPIAQKALPSCNIAYLDKEEMKEALEGYFNTLLEQNPASVGGALPEDAFYYIP